jgi:hypothetical protein
MLQQQRQQQQGLEFNEEEGSARSWAEQETLGFLSSLMKRRGAPGGWAEQETLGFLSNTNSLYRISFGCRFSSQNDIGSSCAKTEETPLR